MDLSELEFENIGAWPKLIKAIFIALCCSVVLILGAWFLVKPQFQKLDRAQLTQTQLLETYEQKYFVAANLRAYEEQLEKIKLMFGSMLGQLPNQSEIPTTSSPSRGCENL